MRLQSLNLKAFGPFTDRVVSFKDKASLHIVYGPNESGKTSTLRALKTLLYGFAPKTKDNFLHPNPKLQVGGTLRLADGSLQEFVRWKRRLRSLTDSAGEPLEERFLHTVLQGTNSELFDRLYGLSHRNIVDGGKALLSSGGAVGESLFAASLGPEYHDLAQQLKTEVENLWTSRSRTLPLDKCLLKWQESQRRVGELTLSTQDWAAVRSALDQALARQEELKKVLAEGRLQLSSHQKHLDAAPDAVRRKELSEELAVLGDCVLLKLDFSERRAHHQAELAKQRTRLESNQLRLKSLQKEVDELPEPSSILEMSERIEALYRRVPVVTEHALEQPLLQQDLDDCRKRIKSLLAELAWQGEERPQIPSGRWRKAARQKSQDYLRLQSQMRDAETEVSEIEESLDSRVLAEPKEEQILELEDIERALASAQKERVLDERIAGLEKEIRLAQTRLKLSLDKLSSWSGEAQTLAKLRVPSETLVRQYKESLADKTARLDTLEREDDRLTKELLQAQGLLKECKDNSNFEGVERLEKARLRRGELWEEIHHSWHQGDAPQSTGTLVSEFLEAVASVDNIADELRQSSEKWAQLQQADEKVQQLERDLRVLGKELDKARATLAEEQDRWRALWTDTNILLDAPEVMLGWLAQRELVLEDFHRLEHRQAELEEARGRLKSELQSLQEKASPLGLGDFSIHRGASDAIDKVEQKLDLLRTAAAKRKEELQKHSLLSKRKERLTARLNQLKQSEKDWQSDWVELTAEFSKLDKLEARELEDVLSLLESLSREFEVEIQGQERLTRAQKEVDIFAEEVQRLRAHLDFEETDEFRLIERAFRACGDAHKTEDKRENLKLEIKSLGQEEEELKLAFDASLEAVNSLLLEAGVERPEDLADAISRSTQKHELKKELKDVEQRLRHRSGHLSVGEFCAAIAELDLERLPLEITELEEQLEHQQSELEGKLHEIGRLEQDLKSKDGRSESARLQQEAESIKAEGLEIVERYLQLSMAERMLSSEIEDYRKRHEGPILDLASRFFQQLTDGHYTEVKTGYDDSGLQLVLMAVAKSGREVNVEALSDGTCDQLFLALRLATISHNSKSSQGLPIVADDILVQFDDQRARSCLSALLEFSEQTQVVLFTHLERDYALAEELRDKRVDLIRLESLAL